MKSFTEQSRLALGLGQQELANYLKISRPRYSLAEKNLRPMPHESYLLLTELMAHFPAHPTGADVISVTSYQKGT